MSSHGVRISAALAFSAGRRMEVAINWPVALNENCRLKLTITGEVVRTDADQVVVSIQRHEFRTGGQWTTPAS